MGIIVRQGIKTSIVNFIGAFIGMLSVLFIYPLEKEVVGFANNLYSMAFFLSPFIGYGVSAIAVKFYHRLKEKDETSPSGFLFTLLVYIFLTLLFLVLVSIFFKKHIYNFLESIHFDSSIFSSNEVVIISLATILVVLSLLTAFSQIRGRNTIPSIITNLGYKLFLPFVVILVFYNYLNDSNVDLFVLFFHLIALAFLAVYVIQFGIFNTNKKGLINVIKLKSEMLAFGLYSALTSLGTIMAFKIDSIMISGLLGYAATGSYTLPMTMAAVMDIPNQAILGITGPIVSKAWIEKDILHLKEIYQKASANLLIAGIYILLMGTFCFEDLIRLSTNPSAFEGTKYIFIILCFAKLTDMATSINSAIIGYSDFYKFNLYFVAILGISNVGLNLFLIPRYGIAGAAWATFISLTIFNIIKLLFIYFKFHLNPFTNATIKTLFLGIILFLMIINLNYISENVFISIFLKALFLTAIYLFTVFKMNLSEDLNEVLLRYINLFIFNKKKYK